MIGSEGKRARHVVILLLGAFLFQGGAALWHMSSTSDETHYFGMGIYLMKNRQWDVLDDALLHPPLSYYLHSLPLFLTDIDENVFLIPDRNERGRTILASRSDDRLLMLARTPMLLMGAVLGMLIYYWVVQTYGFSAALLALFLYVFSPAILSNASLITPDFCLTFFAVLTFYCVWRFLVTQKATLLLGAGLALGLSLLSKYSAILVVLSLPIFVLVQSFHRDDQNHGQKGRLSLPHVAVILLIAILVINLGYFFSGSFRLLQEEAFQSELFQGLQSAGAFRWIPSPLPEAYVMGLDLQYTLVERGFNYYLLGETSQEGWLHYYLVAFLVKTPLPLLILLGAGVVLSLKRGQDQLQLLLLIPILLFPLYFSVFQVSRGIRYLLPIYPLLCVWVARLVPWTPERVMPRLKWVLLGLLFWQMAGSLWVAPHYLAYFNELVGGPSHGYKYLYEADFDWGQELKGLKNYLQRNELDRIQLAYFGTADPQHYGIDFEPLLCGAPQPEEGLIGVSATALQFLGCFDWLNQYEAIDRVGYTIFIYRLPEVP